MKKLLLVLMLSMPMVAFAAKKNTPPPLDVNCEKMADVVEGLGKLKAIGYSVGELSAFTTETTVQVFPIQSLKKFVYTTDKSPVELRSQLSALCNSVGFDTYNRFLLQEEQLETLRTENQTLKESVSVLEAEIKTLKESKKTTRK